MELGFQEVLEAAVLGELESAPDVEQLAKRFEEMRKKAETEIQNHGSPFAEITDDDIDNLFSD